MAIEPNRTSNRLVAALGGLVFAGGVALSCEQDTEPAPEVPEGTAKTALKPEAAKPPEVKPKKRAEADQAGTHRADAGAATTLEAERFRDMDDQYITDDRGRALYLFSEDEKGESHCYEDCAETWPPLLVSNKPVKVADGLSPDLVGTTERKDGTKQVTYGGFPLYYYIKDEGRAAAGKHIRTSGGTWHLVTPSGKRLK